MPLAPRPRTWMCNLQMDKNNRRRTADNGNFTFTKYARNEYEKSILYCVQFKQKAVRKAKSQWNIIRQMYQIHYSASIIAALQE